MSISEKLLLQNKILGVLIRDARQAAGKTPKECAEFLGVSESQFTDYEIGESPISLPELEAFAYSIHVPIEHFLGDQTIQLPEQPFPVEELVALRNRVIGVLLLQARLDAGMSKEECGQAINVSESRISAYEQGRMAIPLSELQALAAIVNVPMETFLDIEHNPISKMTHQSSETVELDHLPEDVRAFFMDPLNADYLRTAQRLSNLPTDQLRGMAETLLEITY